MQSSFFLKGAGCVLAAVLLLGGCPPKEPEPLKTPLRARITQAELDAGKYNVYELIEFGRFLNLFKFDVKNGYGNGRSNMTPPNFSRLVGPDSVSCNSCHGLGNVVLGWGGNEANVLVQLDDPLTPTVAGSNERNTVPSHGLVWLELLAKEMSEELRSQREAASLLSAQTGETVPVNLHAKGISYGQIVANPDGTFDMSGLVGCDADLRIRPFHAKGQITSIRVFTRNALNRHHGIESWDFLKKLDPSKAPAAWDNDEDGVVDELNEAELTAMTLHQVGLPAPVETKTGHPNVEAGRALMDTFACTVCHIPSLNVAEPIWRDTSSTGTEITVNLLNPFLGTPRLVANPNGSVDVPLWGDLRRHDLGPESHEPQDQPVDNSLPWWDGGGRGESITETLPPVPRELMLTTELWGVGDTGPWWHDGSSPTIEHAILRHGGDAQASRDAYANATDEERAQLLAFLSQLRVGLVGEVLGASKSGEILISDPAHAPLNRTNAGE